MTKKILIDEAVVKQASEWIEDAAVVLSHTSTAIQGGLGAEAEGVGGCSVKVLKDLREALEVNNKGVNALAEQAAEPVACDKDPRGCWNVRCQLGGVCKNTHPASTQQDGTNGVVALQERLRQEPVALQPLTDEQIDRIADQHPAYLGSVYPHAFARAIEAALGITGNKT